MNILESFRISLRALNANKVRALLTMLGIIIGVSSVILLVSIGTGVKDELLGELEGMGSNLIYVMPTNMDSMMTGGGGGGMMGLKKFSLDDLGYLESKMPGTPIAPLVTGGIQAAVGSKEIAATIQATNATGSDIMSIMKVAEGRMYYGSEVAGASRVVLIGDSLATQLFGGRSPINQQIRLSGQRFRVIGVLEKQGGMSATQDSIMLMPYTSAMKVLGTSDIAVMLVGAPTQEDVPLLKTKLSQAMRPVRGAEFSIMTQDQMGGMMGNILGTLTYMLAGIAGIALLVGGIGIMNIMLVSVSERTREIGIRKAVGARTYDIMMQFVVESLVLSVLGGLIGIALGAAGGWALSFVVPTTMTPWAVALAFFFSAGIGVFFGVYPAYKASQLDPIEALRYE